MPDHLEIRVPDQMGNISFIPGEIVIDAGHIMTLREQYLHEMGAQEPGSAGD
jgi:hypothetical protein